MKTSPSNEQPNELKPAQTVLSPIQKLKRGLSFLCSGFALGVLAGLSSSPIASDLITGLLAVIVSMLLVSSGLKIANSIPILEKVSGISVNPAPIATTVGGITLGTLIGIIIKVNGLLTMPGWVESKWEGYDLRDNVSQVLFNKTFRLPYSIQIDTVENRKNSQSPTSAMDTLAFKGGNDYAKQPEPVIPEIEYPFRSDKEEGARLKKSCEMLNGSKSAKEIRDAILNDYDGEFSRDENKIANDSTISIKEFYEKIKDLCK
jgi:hypothetical protein